MEFYRETGAAPLGGVVRTLGVGVPAAAILGACYGFALNQIPLIHIAFFATLAVAICGALLTAKLLKAGKIRSRPIAVILAAALGLTTWYVAWAVDPVARFGWKNAPFVFDPVMLKNYWIFGYEKGLWAIPEHPVTGTAAV